MKENTFIDKKLVQTDKKEMSDINHLKELYFNRRSELIWFLLTNPTIIGLLNKISLKSRVIESKLLDHILENIDSLIDLDKRERFIDDFIERSKLPLDLKGDFNNLVENILKSCKTLEFLNRKFKWIDYRIISYNSFLIKTNSFFWSKTQIKVYIPIDQIDSDKFNFEVEYVDNNWDLRIISLSKSQLIDLLKWKVVKISNLNLVTFEWTLLSLENLKGQYKYSTILHLRQRSGSYKYIRFLSNTISPFDLSRILIEKWKFWSDNFVEKILTEIVDYIVNILPYSKISQFLKLDWEDIVFLSNEQLDKVILNFLSNDYLSFDELKKNIVNNLLSELKKEWVLSELETILLEKLDFDKSWGFEVNKVINYPRFLWFLKVLFWKQTEAIRGDYVSWNVVVNELIFSEKFIYNVFSSLIQDWKIKSKADFLEVYNKIAKIWKQLLIAQKIYEKFGEDLRKLSSWQFSESDIKELKQKIDRFKNRLKALKVDDGYLFRIWFAAVYSFSQQSSSDLISEVEKFVNNTKYCELEQMIDILGNNSKETLWNVLIQRNLEKYEKLWLLKTEIEKDLRRFWPIIQKIDALNIDELKVGFGITKTKNAQQSFKLDNVYEIITEIENWKVVYSETYHSFPLWNWMIYYFPDWEELTLYYIEAENPDDIIVIKRETRGRYKLIKKDKYSFKIDLSKNLIEIDFNNIKAVTWLRFSKISWWRKKDKKVMLDFDQNFNITKFIFPNRQTALNFGFQKDLLDYNDDGYISISINQDLNKRIYVWISNSVKSRQFFDYIMRQDLFRYLIWYKWDNYNLWLSFRDTWEKLSIWVDISRTKQEILKEIEKAKQKVDLQLARNLLSIVFPNAKKEIIRKLAPVMLEILQNVEIRDSLVWKINSLSVDYTFIPNVMTLFAISLGIIYDVEILKQLIPWKDINILKFRQALLNVWEQLKKVRYIKDITLSDLEIWKNKYRLIPDFIIDSLPKSDRIWNKIWIRQVNVWFSPSFQDLVDINTKNGTFSFKTDKKIVPSIFINYTLDGGVILDIYFGDDIVWAETKSKYMYTSGDIPSFEKFRLKRAEISLRKEILKEKERNMKEKLELLQKRLIWEILIKLAVKISDLPEDKIIDKVEKIIDKLKLSYQDKEKLKINLKQELKKLYLKANNIVQIKKLIFSTSFRNESNYKKLIKLVFETFWSEMKEYNITPSQVLWIFYKVILDENSFSFDYLKLKKDKDKQNFIVEFLKNVNKLNIQLRNLLWQKDFDILDFLEISWKEIYKVEWWLTFAITKKWLLTFSINDLIITNGRVYNFDIPWYKNYKLQMLVGLYNWNPVINLQLKKKNNVGYIVRNVENFETADIPLLKKLYFTLGYVYIPPIIDKEYIDIVLAKDEQYLKKEWISSTFKGLHMPTIAEILEWRLQKIWPDYFKQNDLYIPPISEDAILNWYVLPDKVEKDWNIEKDIFVISDWVKVIYKFEVDEYWNKVFVWKEVFINNEKLKTPEDFWIPQITPELAEKLNPHSDKFDKDLYQQIKRKIDKYIDYLAKTINTPEKWAAFLSWVMKYSYDEEIAEKFYNVWYYDFSDFVERYINVVMQYTNWSMMGDCDSVASLVKEILNRQWIPAIIEWVPGHAFSLVYFPTKDWMMWMTIWTFGVDIKYWYSLFDLNYKLFEKYNWLWLYGGGEQFYDTVSNVEIISNVDPIPGAFGYDSIKVDIALINQSTMYSFITYSFLQKLVNISARKDLEYNYKNSKNKLWYKLELESYFVDDKLFELIVKDNKENIILRKKYIDDLHNDALSWNWWWTYRDKKWKLYIYFNDLVKKAKEYELDWKVLEIYNKQQRGDSSNVTNENDWWWEHYERESSQDNNESDNIWELLDSLLWD